MKYWELMSFEISGILGNEDIVKIMKSKMIRGHIEEEKSLC